MREEKLYTNFNLYQNANATTEAVKESFLVRQYEYSVIVSDLFKNPRKGSVQHYLLLGKRGSGKSTLLKRVQIEIETNEELASAYIAINLAEEQANIYRLFDLLEEIVRELGYHEIETEDFEIDRDMHVYARRLFYVIHKALEKNGKKLVLLLDNIDRIFENLDDEVSLLRENLENYGDIKIIGSSTRMTEHFWAYDKPFYEFFRVMELKPLNSEEIKELLLNWGLRLQVDELKDFVENKPGQLETIRILTDGLPRTLQFFVNILLTHAQETGYEYLRLLMDKVTPLYQERLNHLPPSQRKIVLQLAFLWEAVGAKELAQATRMENRVISAQLNQLIEKGVAEKIETKTKNHLYRLSERFFNLWLIFTQGSPREKRRARYLSIFLENFYNTNELNEMAKKHLHSLMKEKTSFDNACLVTKAFAQSKYISSGMRDALILETLQLQGANERISELPNIIFEILEEAHREAKKENWNKVEQIIKEIEQDDGVKEFISGLVYYSKDFKQAEEYLLRSTERGFLLASTALGRIYDNEGETAKAEYQFQLAVENEVPGSSYLLADYYYCHNLRKDPNNISLLISSIGRDGDEEELAIVPVLKVWNGDFRSLKEDVSQLIRRKNPFLSHCLMHLLFHHQVNFVDGLFASEEFGPQLVEELLPIYYTTRLLMPDAHMSSIKVPPELQETVNSLLAGINDKHDFYYRINRANARRR